MKKTELIDQVASKVNLSKTDAASAIDAIVSCIGSALASGDSVTLVGFGTFSVSARAARTGRNPRTGEPIQIAASRLVRFKAGKSLKDSVN